MYLTHKSCGQFCGQVGISCAMLMNVKKIIFLMKIKTGNTVQSQFRPMSHLLQLSSLLFEEGCHGDIAYNFLRCTGDCHFRGHLLGRSDLGPRPDCSCLPESLPGLSLHVLPFRIGVKAFTRGLLVPSARLILPRHKKTDRMRSVLFGEAGNYFRARLAVFSAACVNWFTAAFMFASMTSAACLVLRVNCS